MSELMPIHQSLIGNKTIQAVNARDIHGYLEVKTEYAHWFSRRVSTYGFVQDIDYTDAIFGDGPMKTIEHYVTLDMAKQLAMVERTEKGKEGETGYAASVTRPSLPPWPGEAARYRLAAWRCGFKDTGSKQDTQEKIDKS